MKFLSTTQKLKLYGRAVENLSYLAGGKNLSPPIIAWLLTKRCNLSCMHCTSHLDRRKIDQKGLENIALKIARSKTVVVVLSGGEPLLVPNIREIIMILKNAGKIVKLNTNGLNLDKHADFLIEQQIECITVSIDSVIPEEHDRIRGKSGSFKSAVESLEYIKKNRKGSLPYTEVRGVVMKENFSTIPEYLRTFQSKFDAVELQPIHDNQAHHEVVDESVLFSEADKAFEQAFEKTIREVSNEFPEFRNNYFHKFGKFLFHQNKMETESLNACLPTWMNFMPVNEEGTCLSCSQAIGNLHEQEVAEIWSGEKRMGFLKSIAGYGKCKTPCWLNCTTVAPVWMGSIFRNYLKLFPPDNAAMEDFKRSSLYLGHKPSATAPKH